MLVMAENTPAGGGGGSLPANLVTGTSAAYNIAYWETSSSIEGYGGFTYSPGSGLSLTGGASLSGNLWLGDGMTINSGPVKFQSWYGLVSASDGYLSPALAVPNQFGYGETQWATNGGTIGTISYYTNTPPLNGITGTLGGTINLPSGGSFQGQMIIIKDEGGNALSANIIVSGNGNTIDGASTYVLNENYASVTVYWNGTSWFTI